MLLIVIGAGASFDSSPFYPPGGVLPACRPPLANNLFQDRDATRHLLGAFPQFHALIPYLVPRTNRSLEESLQRLQDESTTDPVRTQQLTAIRYYLQQLFRFLTSQWLAAIGDVTNYQALLDQVRHFRKGAEPTCIVTFNYDTLIEHALGRYGMDFNSIDDYVSHAEFKLFKLHGSDNWGRILEGQVPNEVVGRRSADPWANSENVIKHAAALTPSDNFVVTGTPHTQPAELPLFPAIAIPVVTKDLFECPTNHVHQLVTLLPRVTKILTIGWRGSEQHFLSLLRAAQIRALSIVSIAASAADAEETLAAIRRLGIGIRSAEGLTGFSEALAVRQLDAFLAAE